MPPQHKSALVPPRSKSGHLRALDGLRGLAVLGVMASHLFPGNYPSGGLLIHWAAYTLMFGARGVDLFFVLSGFLITGILYDSLGDAGFFRKFYARRCLRIFPLYYGVLIVLFALTPWLHLEWHNMQWSLLFYMQNTNLVMPIWDFRLSHGLELAHFWSLAVEEQFYLMWPLAVFLIRDRRKLLATCATMSVISILWRFFLAYRDTPFHYINSGTLCRADSLLIGGALALLIRGRAKQVVIRSGPIVFLSAAVALIVLNLCALFAARQPRLAIGFNDLYLSVVYTFFAFGSSGLIAWCLQPGSLATRIFENSTLRWFGKYSYGLYVLHLVAIGFLLQVFRSWAAHFTSSKLLLVVASGLMVLPIAILAAYASFHLYEKQFLRLKRFFEYDRPESIPRAAPEPAA